MSFTMEDFKRQYVKEHFARLTPEEQREALQALPPEEQQEVLQALPPEKRLAGLPPEQRLAGLSAEQIRGVPGPAGRRPPGPTAKAAAEEVTRRCRPAKRSKVILYATSCCYSICG